MKFNEKLKDLRKGLGLTLKETSLRLGIPLTTCAIIFIRRFLWSSKKKLKNYVTRKV